MKNLCIALGLTALLASCTTTNTPETDNNITVTGASTIAIGQTKALSAVGGNVAGGGTVTWTSSDPELISVDASGKITAHHFSLEAAKKTVTITATSGDKTGTATIMPYGLDISCGTYVNSLAPEAKIAFYTRFRMSDGSNIGASTNYQVTGPGGFNEGKTIQGMVFKSSSAGSLYGGTSAVTGTYNASLTVAGVNYTDTCALDAKRVLGTIGTPVVTVTGNKASFSGIASGDPKNVFAQLQSEKGVYATRSYPLTTPAFSLQDDLTPVAPSGTYTTWIMARNFSGSQPMPDVVLMSDTQVGTLTTP